jgi:hypothetical protein
LGSPLRHALLTARYRRWNVPDDADRLRPTLKS